jgi:hypothetical protein
MSALQDSLHGTDYEVALLSQENTALHHTTVAQVQRQPATWLSGDYHDRTCTG